MTSSAAALLFSRSGGRRQRDNGRVE